MEINFNPVESSLKSKAKCEVCGKNEAPYTCPRCNLLYCSSKCYQDLTKHFNCSEEFYKEQVITELKMCKIEDQDESKAKMVEILKREAQT